MDWRHKAVCRDEDPELFFPVGNSGPALAQIADAKLVCARCTTVLLDAKIHGIDVGRTCLCKQCLYFVQIIHLRQREKS